MPSENQRPAHEIRAKFAEMKRSLSGLAPAERIAQELRFAREFGLTVTATEAASIVRPTQNRFQADAALMRPPAAVDECSQIVRERGQGADLSMRRAMSDVLRSSAFTPSSHSAHIRELNKSLRTTADVESVITRVSAEIDLAAARGDQHDLVREALSAIEQAVFACADPLKSKKGVGGETNA